jgi:hypothetical protein
MCKPSNQLVNTTTSFKGERAAFSNIPMFYRFEPVLYLDPVAKFPETIERPGFFVGFVDNAGDISTLKILKSDLSTALHRSIVVSAADTIHRNNTIF